MNRTRINRIALMFGLLCALAVSEVTAPALVRKAYSFTSPEQPGTPPTEDNCLHFTIKLPFIGTFKFTICVE